MSVRLSFCPNCSAFIPAKLQNCGGCGRSAFDDPAIAPSGIGEASPESAASTPSAETVPAPPVLAMAAAGPAMPGAAIPMAAPAATNAPRLPQALLGAVAAVIVAMAAAGGYLYYARNLSFTSRIARALENDRIFSPPGDCAADIFAAERAKNPNSNDVKKAAEAIRAKLEPIGAQAFQKWYVDSEGVDWDFVEKAYAFLADVTSDPRNQSRHEYAAGQLSLQGQNHAQALAHYSEAYRLDPTSVLALNGLAKVYVQESSPFHNEATAIAYYNKAAALDPHFTWAYKNLGEYYMRIEDWRTGESFMLKALETSPQRPSILRSLARIYFNLKDYPRALDYNQRYIAVERDPAALARAQAAIVQIQQLARR